MRLGNLFGGLLAVLGMALCPQARAQMTEGPDAAFANEIVMMTPGDHSITGLLISALPRASASSLDTRFNHGRWREQQAETGR